MPSLARFDWTKPTAFMRKHESLDDGKHAERTQHREVSPLTSLERAESAQLLRDAIDSWGMRDPRDRSKDTARLMLKGYGPKEIADTLQVSRSRGSQLVKDVIARFKAMRDNVNIRQACIFDSLSRV